MKPKYSLLINGILGLVLAGLTLFLGIVFITYYGFVTGASLTLLCVVFLIVLILKIYETD